MIVDDHPVVRDGVASALQGRDDIEVIGGVGSRTEAAAAAVELHPDLMLVDLHMPGGGGVELIRDISRTLPDVKCLVLTMDDDDESLYAAMRAGACGYLLKGARGDEIERAVRAAAAGEVVFGTGMAERVRALFGAVEVRPGARAFPSLSERELTLLDLLAQGLDNIAIARRVGVAPKTVRNQLSMLLTKLAVADRSAAVAAARDAGLGRGGG